MQMICNLASCLAMNFEQFRSIKVLQRSGHCRGCFSNHFSMHIEQKCVSHSWQETGFHRTPLHIAEQRTSPKSDSDVFWTRSTMRPSVLVDVIRFLKEKTSGYPMHANVLSWSFFYIPLRIIMSHRVSSHRLAVASSHLIIDRLESDRREMGASGLIP